jgi:hypothetical protein
VVPQRGAPTTKKLGLISLFGTVSIMPDKTRG